MNGADLRVQTAKLPNGTIYESPVRFIESKFGDTDMSAVQVDRLVVETQPRAGIKADKEVLALMSPSRRVGLGRKCQPRLHRIGECATWSG